MGANTAALPSLSRTKGNRRKDTRGKASASPRKAAVPRQAADDRPGTEWPRLMAEMVESLEQIIDDEVAGFELHGGFAL